MADYLTLKGGMGDFGKNIVQTHFEGKNILHSKIYISIIAFNAETFLCCTDRFDVIRILSREILGKKVLTQTK